MNLTNSKLVFHYLIVVSLACSSSLWAHGKVSLDDGISIDSGLTVTNTDGTLPFAVGGDFELVDHYGNTVSNKDYLGKHMLVFFGYASCKNMCSISLSRMGEALELLGPSVENLSALMVTVDPSRDTPDVMKSELVKYHPSLIGLTGSPEQLDTMYQAYKQKPVDGTNDWNGDPIISHTSYFYLIDKHGKFSTLFPPVLNPQSMADIIQKHIDSAV